MQIKVYNSKNEVVFDRDTKYLPFPENLILQNSIRFFNDPAPCFIHKGAVIARLAADIEECFAGGAPLPISSLGSELSSAFSDIEDAASAIVY